MLSIEIMKYFGFLIEKYGFVKLPEYQYVREVHNDFVGNEMIIKLNYEGSLLLEILKPKFDITEILNNQKRTVDYDYNSFDRFDLKNLDLKREIYNAVLNKNFPGKDFWYYSKLLEENPEILNGDLTKLKWKYRFLKRLKLK